MYVVEICKARNDSEGDLAKDIFGDRPRLLIDVV
jgi:hypothetical protein